MSHKVTYICAKCGCDEIVFDAIAHWNVEEQCMEVANVFDKGHSCKRCNHDKQIEVELQSD